jgi:hypothetical protein
MGQNVMPLLNDVLAWCEKERERLRQQEALLARGADGKQTGEGNGDATHPTLRLTLAGVRKSIAELDALIARHRG